MTPPMNHRIRLTLATALVGIARRLLRIGAFLTARLPEAAPVVHTSDTAAPTFDELVSALHRFTHERAPLFPGEGVAFAMYVAVFSEACAPALARFRAAFAPTPPPETAVENADDVN